MENMDGGRRLESGSRTGDRANVLSTGREWYEANVFFQPMLIFSPRPKCIA